MRSGCPPTARDIRGLIESYVREEFQYRDALKLGLDRDDTLMVVNVGNDLHVAGYSPWNCELTSATGQQRHWPPADNLVCSALNS